MILAGSTHFFIASSWPCLLNNSWKFWKQGQWWKTLSQGYCPCTVPELWLTCGNVICSLSPVNLPYVNTSFSSYVAILLNSNSNALKFLWLLLLFTMWKHIIYNEVWRYKMLVLQFVGSKCILLEVKKNNLINMH